MDKEKKRKVSKGGQGLSRRGFMASVGAGAAVAAATGRATAQPVQEIKSAADLVEVTLDVNGRRRKVLVEPRWTLLYVLRDIFGLTGAKPGCERGECGACTVLIDDLPRYSCLTLAVEAEGRKITTLEGLMDGEKLGPVQQAFAEEDAFQCGFCTPGQIMAVEGLLRANPAPSLDEIRLGVSGNLCRCGAYQNIFRAAGKAAELKRKGGA
jgi:xanthine dehydrogenase YagT iron-sulfur-binding subunit